MSVLNHTDFNAAFSRGTVFEHPRLGNVPVQQVESADLILPSGRIIACDPALLHLDATPFVHAVNPGRYPVTLCVTTVPDQPHYHRRVACVIVRFTSEEPVAWHMAVRPGEDPADLPEGQTFCYGVDTGLGCFVDAEAAHAVPEERILAEVEKFPLNHLWSSTVLDPRTGANLLSFASGLGDGGYPSYWGADRSGQFCCLATDFEFLVDVLSGSSTFRVQDWVGKTLSDPGLARAGMTVRLVPFEHVGGRRLRVEILGHFDGMIIMSGGKECPPLRGHYHISARNYSDLIYPLDDSLGRDAEITVWYSLGVRPLKTLSRSAPSDPPS